jgi:protein-S-isoprenylcysteine O-methyltransferase Ste14
MSEKRKGTPDSINPKPDDTESPWGPVVVIVSLVVLCAAVSFTSEFLGWNSGRGYGFTAITLAVFGVVGLIWGLLRLIWGDRTTPGSRQR